MALSPKLLIPIPVGAELDDLAHELARLDAIDDNAATQVQADRPFNILSAVWNVGANRLDVGIGQGRANFLGTHVVKASDTAYQIAGPATTTSYYVYLQSSAAFAHNTTGVEVATAVLLWRITTGATNADPLVVVDMRGELPGASARIVGDTLATHTAAASPHTGHLTAADIGGVPVNQAIGDAAGAGAGATAARYDHRHGMPAFAAPTVALGSAAAAGAAATLIRSDATIQAFDATAPSTQAVGDAAAVGVINYAARRDHKHAMPAFGSPGASAVGDAAADGVAVTIARADHRHSREAFATNTFSYGTATAAGVATTHVRPDATLAIFNAANPTAEAFGDTASVGAAAFAARQDHRHAMPANPVAYASPGLTLGTANAAGVASTLIRSDATIAAFDATAPTSSAVGDAASAGSAAVAARRDHIHGREAFATPVAVGAANAAGAASTISRSDHVHQGGLVKIAELSGASADYDFTSIPATYTHLELWINGRSTAAGVDDTFNCQINGDTAGNYEYMYLLADASVNGLGRATGQSQFQVGREMAADGATAGKSGIATVKLPNYKGTTYNKTIVSEIFSRRGTTDGNQDWRNGLITGYWLNAAAINRIRVYPGTGSWKAGSIASLYGRL